MSQAALGQAELDSLVAGWLANAGVSWPAQLAVTAKLVEVLPEEDSRPFLDVLDSRVHAGPPEGAVRIRWLPERAEALIHASTPRIELRFTRDALADFEVAERGFLLLAFIFALRRAGWHHVHAATLEDPIGRGWMFAGSSNSGKSTTTALLAGAGWRAVTDDITFLTASEQGVSAHGFQSTISLREGGLTLLGPSGGIPQPRRHKTGFHLRELGGEWARMVRPEILVFPSIGEATTLEPIAVTDAFRLLFASAHTGLFESERSQEFLDILARLVEGARCFRATLGPDLIANPSILLEMVP